MTVGKVEAWEGRSRAALVRRWGAAGLHVYGRLGSTNDLARGLAAAGAAAGTLVLAEEQTAGRGRVGRGWASPPDLGLWFSAIARPTGDPSLLPLRVGLAIAESLDPFLGGERVLLKWPNDLLVGVRKLGGILCEGSWEASGRGFVAVGVGLNVLHRAGDFPPDLSGQAISLALAVGAPVDRGAVADAVVPAVLAALTGTVELDAALLDRLNARDALRGNPVEVTDPATGHLIARGTALGIAPDGSLLIGENDAFPRAVRSGTVRLAAGAAHPNRF